MFPVYKLVFFTLIAGFIGVIFHNILVPESGFWLSMVVIIASLALSFQGIFTLMWMLYAWENSTEFKTHKSIDKYLPPKFAFSALLPARHEEKVIGDTIRAISDIDYPEELKEIIVLCRSDDQETILEANKTIESLGKDNIQVLVFDDLPINKPHSLNIGLIKAHNRAVNITPGENQTYRDIYNTNQVITIFDAEDQPHPEIYNVVNTEMESESADVVQSGVQLMNYRSHWFSAINVLEYFFWFKSGLRFFSKIGNVTPLGGNTVFFKKDYLDKIGGWDENCLTEDADIGIRLANAGAKVRVIYDERLVTREETPDSVKSFIKQRTRWNHGFLQILMKKDWKDLPQMRQKMIALYTLTAPMIQMIFLAYLPLGILIGLFSKLPIPVSIISFIPMFIFLIQIAVYFIGIKEFTRTYKINYSIRDSLNIVIVFFPYQIMMAIASVRAMHRLMSGENSWEKTSHINAHRAIYTELSPAYAYAEKYLPRSF